MSSSFVLPAGSSFGRFVSGWLEFDDVEDDDEPDEEEEDDDDDDDDDDSLSLLLLLLELGDLRRLRRLLFDLSRRLRRLEEPFLVSLLLLPLLSFFLLDR